MNFTKIRKSFGNVSLGIQLSAFSVTRHFANYSKTPSQPSSPNKAKVLKFLPVNMALKILVNFKIESVVSDTGSIFSKG